MLQGNKGPTLLLSSSAFSAVCFEALSQAQPPYLLSKHLHGQSSAATGKRRQAFDSLQFRTEQDADGGGHAGPCASRALRRLTAVLTTVRASEYLGISENQNFGAIKTVTTVLA